MICPKCGHVMRVTHSISAGAAGSTRRYECQSGKCRAVAITKTEIVAVDPPRGQGAYALAQKMRRVDVKF